MRVLLKTLDMSVSHSCAWKGFAITIVCACVGIDLYVMLSGGFSLNYASCAIYAKVRVWKLPDLLIATGMIWTRSLFSCCVSL